AIAAPYSGFGRHLCRNRYRRGFWPNTARSVGVRDSGGSVRQGWRERYCGRRRNRDSRQKSRCKRTRGRGRPSAGGFVLAGVARQERAETDRITVHVGQAGGGLG